MTYRPYIVLGEALVDLISAPGGWRFDATAGGSPLNVAVGLAAARRAVRLACDRGDDLFGTLLDDHLRRYGVDRAEVAVTTAPTGLAIARLDDTGAAEYDFRLTWDRATVPDLTDAAGLHIGSLSAVLAPGADTVRAAVAQARARQVPVSYDPNVRPPLMPADARDRVAELVAVSDLVKVSAEDLAWLDPAAPVEQTAAQWLAAGPRLVVVTHGAGGATAWYQGRVLAVTAPTVPVVDTVGAGDAFTAGLLAALSDAAPLTADPPPEPARVADALRQATAAGTVACRHRGAAPPEPTAVTELAGQVRLRWD